MPTTVHQLIEGTEVTTGASPSVTLKYFVDGAASENAALDAVLSTCPATYNGMPRQSRSAEPICDTKYLVPARYSSQESNDPGSSGQAPPSLPFPAPARSRRPLPCVRRGRLGGPAGACQVPPGVPAELGRTGSAPRQLGRAAGRRRGRRLWPPWRSGGSPWARLYVPS